MKKYINKIFEPFAKKRVLSHYLAKPLYYEHMATLETKGAEVRFELVDSSVVCFVNLMKTQFVAYYTFGAVKNLTSTSLYLCRGEDIHLLSSTNLGANLTSQTHAINKLLN